MYAKILFALVMCFVFVQEPSVEKPWNFIENPEPVKSLVKIETYFNIPHMEIKAGFGSGSIVHHDDNYTYILTCMHVVDKGSRFSVIDSSGKSHDAVIVIVSQAVDLAVLIVPKLDFPALEIADAYPKVGAEVEMLGWGYQATDKPRQWRAETSVGSVPLKRTIVNCPFQPGDSGGPILKDGKLLSVMSAGLNSYYIEDGTHLCSPGLGTPYEGVKQIMFQVKMYEFPFK